jgi:hypothetical protein
MPSHPDRKGSLVSEHHRVGNRDPYSIGKLGSSSQVQSFTSSVQLTPAHKVPFLPASALPIRDIPPGFIPYISLLDLIVFKIDSSGLYRTLGPRMRDALDAAALLEYASRHQPLQFSYRKERIIRRGLPDAIEYSGREWGWWYRRLGFGGYSRRHNHSTLLISEHCCTDLQCEDIWDDHRWDACIYDFPYHDQPGCPCTPNWCPQHGHGPCGPDYQDSHDVPKWKRRRRTSDSRKELRRTSSSKSDPCLSARLSPGRLEKPAPETHIVYRVNRPRASSSQGKRRTAVDCSEKRVYEMSGALSPPPARPLTSTTTYVVRGRRTEPRDAKPRAAPPPPAPTQKATPAKTSSGGGGEKAAPAAAAATATAPVVPARKSSEHVVIRGGSYPVTRSDDRGRPAAGGSGNGSSGSKTTHRRTWTLSKNSSGGLSCFTGSNGADSSDVTASDSIRSYVRTRPPEVVFVTTHRGRSGSVSHVQQVADVAVSSSKKVRFNLGSR